MYDSIRNVGDFLSGHWLSEAFPGKLKTLTKEWRERTEHGKHSPLRGLSSVSGEFQKAKAALPQPHEDGYAEAVTELHSLLLKALGYEPAPLELETEQSETPITVPLLARCQSPAGEALHVLQAAPVDDADDLLADEGRLLDPLRMRAGKTDAAKVEEIGAVTKGVQQLFLTGHAPRFVLVLAGGWMLLSDVERWAEGRYLAFDVDTALSRKDDKATGELAYHAGLASADVLLPSENGTSQMAEFTDDSVKHAVGVSEDLREGLRVSVELIANEVIAKRRQRGEPVEELEELPRELTTQSLRFLYRILFLLYAEARPELAILPVGAPEYDAGYGLDRLRELTLTTLTGPSCEGHHLHDSLRLLFDLVNTGHGAGTSDSDGLVFEPLRADLFDRGHAYHIDNVNLSNAVLQQVLALLLLSKPSKAKGGRRGFVSYAQLGINQLGAVYEGLMAYSGSIASRELVELAKDGDPSKGTWLVSRENLGQYDEKHIVYREDQLTGEQTMVIHPTGTFVYRLSGRDRQRSASYYTPEVLTQCVVRHSLAELITEDTAAHDILDYRVCEPAMGSGAFLNEALNQLAAEYLTRRQRELNERIDPENYRAELQKVKAYLALYRCYGVDLNDTARELAEISLWLNVMHPGLQAPWFGLHLQRGNSLIGARRATYDLTALGKTKKHWKDTPPTDRPLSEGGIADGEVHHFLLPADGWGAVGNVKYAKEFAPERVQQLKDWKKTVTRKLGKKDADRLRGLAKRVERLWELTLRRLEISEREVARHIDVWRADLDTPSTAVSRERVESELNNPEGPYQRLRLAMDAWCALFFWPVTTDTPPPDLQQWLTMLEGLLGVSGKATKQNGQAELIESIEGFDELADVDELEKTYYGMRPVASLLLEHPWLGVVRSIAEQEGFFHWELDFAQIFTRGGFDLQLGNPPWVRPTWKDDETLAEREPWFVLQDKIPERTFRDRRTEVLSEPHAERQYLDELSSWAGLNEQLGSVVEHPVLSGVQTNLYTSFMERTWRSMRETGTVGLLHPESHFTDPKAGKLRTETYRRLRRHWQFINEAQLFEDVHHQTIYGVQIYGSSRDVEFSQVANLLVPDTLEHSLTHDGSGEVPGIQFPWGGWDTRPHASRVVEITEHTLAQWAGLFDEAGTPAEQARLLRPITREQLDALGAMSEQDARMASLDYQWTSGWHEKGAKEDGYIEWRTECAPDWSEVILQGPQFFVATPFAKEPNENCKSNLDYTDWDLEELPERVIPRTNYQRACDRETYDAGLDHWNDHPYTDYYRLAWRNMTQPGSERSLLGALVPPGPTHVHTVHTLAANSMRNTALVAGLWSSLPFDYLVKVSGASKVNKELVDRFPAPFNHQGASPLLLRALRLNCLTSDYAPLWEEVYEQRFAEDGWTAPFAEWPPLGVTKHEWTWDTPLRTEFERRAALVEIDALTAIMLGLTADQLCLMYRGQFAVLRKYEYNMWFDNSGRKIAKDHHAHGVNQQKEDFKLLQAYLNEEDSGDLLDRYEAPFHKVDRETEMRAAHADFDSRLCR